MTEAREARGGLATPDRWADGNEATQAVRCRLISAAPDVQTVSSHPGPAPGQQATAVDGDAGRKTGAAPPRGSDQVEDPNVEEPGPRDGGTCRFRACCGQDRSGWAFAKD